MNRFAQFSCLWFLVVGLYAEQRNTAFASELPDREFDPNTILSRDHIVGNSIHRASLTEQLPRSRRQTRKHDSYQIASLKCQEYAEARYTRSPTGSKTLRCVDIVPFIANGREAALNEFPHMVSLLCHKTRFVIMDWMSMLIDSGSAGMEALIGYHTSGSNNERWNCGGTLISKRYVLTAAHCLTSSVGPPTVVRLGELILKSSTDSAKHQDFKVEAAISHPNYTTSFRYNDIALLKLSADVRLAPNVRPTCLFTLPNAPRKDKVIITGFGKTGYAETTSEHLLKAKVDLLPTEKCNFSPRSDPKLVRGYDENTMICAGDEKSKSDTCQGDSGGPIQINMKNWKCMWSQLGVTSFGPICGTGRPAVYTKIYPYIPWIQSIVWPQG